MSRIFLPSNSSGLLTPGPRPIYVEENWLAFIDEHGQARDNDHEIPIAAAVLVPPDHEPILRDLVAPLRANHPGDVKARNLTSEERQRVASTILRERWLMYYFALEPRPNRIGYLRDYFRDMAANLSFVRQNARHLDDRIDRAMIDSVEAELQHLAAGGAGLVFTGLMFGLFDGLAQWLHRDGVLPRIRSWVDEKPRSPALMAFLLRLAFLMTYMDVYGADEETLLDVGPRRLDFTCRIGADGAAARSPGVDTHVDGLVVADVVTFYLGIRQRARNGNPHVPQADVAAAHDLVERAQSRIYIPGQPGQAHRRV